MIRVYIIIKFKYVKCKNRFIYAGFICRPRAAAPALNIVTCRGDFNAISTSLKNLSHSGVRSLDRYTCCRLGACMRVDTSPKRCSSENEGIVKSIGSPRSLHASVRKPGALFNATLTADIDALCPEATEALIFLSSDEISRILRNSASSFALTATLRNSASITVLVVMKAPSIKEWRNNS